MPSRTRDKFNTLLVKFYQDVTDKEARAELVSMGASGTRVSTLIRRWAVEVPYWLESEFVEKFYESELIQAVNNSFDKEAQQDGQPED